MRTKGITVKDHRSWTQVSRSLSGTQTATITNSFLESPEKGTSRTLAHHETAAHETPDWSRHPAPPIGPDTLFKPEGDTRSYLTTWVNIWYDAVLDPNSWLWFDTGIVPYSSLILDAAIWLWFWLGPWHCSLVLDSGFTLGTAIWLQCWPQLCLWLWFLANPVSDH